MTLPPVGSQPTTHPLINDTIPAEAAALRAFYFTENERERLYEEAIK